MQHSTPHEHFEVVVDVKEEEFKMLPNVGSIIVTPAKIFSVFLHV